MQKTKSALAKGNEKLWKKTFADLKRLKKSGWKRLPKGWTSSHYFVLPKPSWVRAFRRRLKLSANDFAGVVGVQEAEVRAWETGKSKASGSASRLMGLLARKPYLVKFMRQAWGELES